MNIVKYIKITPEGVNMNGRVLNTVSSGNELLTELYKSEIKDYPKFFKMDTLSKLGFVATELLLKGDDDRFVPREDRAVVLFNRSSSLCDDMHYQKTIQNEDEFFPSPSLFVYTLPNIVTGEIAIRNKYFGETSFYVLDAINEDILFKIIKNAFQDETTESLIGGWLECKADDDFEALIFLCNKNDEDILTYNKFVQFLNNSKKWKIKF